MGRSTTRSFSARGASLGRHKLSHRGARREAPGTRASATMADGLQINPDKELKFRRASPRAARPGSRAAHLAPFGTRLVRKSPRASENGIFVPEVPGTESRGAAPAARTPAPTRPRARVATPVPAVPPRALRARHETDPSTALHRASPRNSRAEEADPDDDPPVQRHDRRARVQGEDHRAEEVLREAQHGLRRARRDADRARHHAGAARVAGGRRGMQGQVPRAERRVGRRHGLRRALRQGQGGHQGVEAARGVHAAPTPPSPVPEGEEDTRTEDTAATAASRMPSDVAGLQRELERYRIKNESLSADLNASLRTKDGAARGFSLLHVLITGASRLVPVPHPSRTFLFPRRDGFFFGKNRARSPRVPFPSQPSSRSSSGGTCERARA